MAVEKDKFKSAYGAKMRVAIDTGDGLTEQNHKAEVDVNNIVRKYNKTGLIDHLNTFEQKYADVTGYDYQESMNTVSAANSLFENMPSVIRNKFGNNVGAFLNFVDNPDNHAEMVEMGLAKPKVVEVDDSQAEPNIPAPGVDAAQAGAKGAEVKSDKA